VTVTDDRMELVMVVKTSIRPEARDRTRGLAAAGPWKPTRSAGGPRMHVAAGGLAVVVGVPVSMP
jgi:hypothetical protein